MGWDQEIGVVEDTASATERTWEPLATQDPGMLPRILGGVGWTLVWLGILTLGFVAHQLWVTTWFAQQGQDALSEEREQYFVETEVETVIVPLDPGAFDDPTIDDGGTPVTTVPVVPDTVALRVEPTPELHDSFALIRIPSIERLSEGWNVVEGTTRRALKTGAGHMVRTPLPGQPGNAVISGHRTTYGAPFHELDELQPGAVIEVETAVGVHVYEVRESFIVKPKDVWVTDALPGAWLTLTTCHPKFSARQRLIVRAEMVAGPNFEAVQQLGVFQ